MKKLLHGLEPVLLALTALLVSHASGESAPGVWVVIAGLSAYLAAWIVDIPSVKDHMEGRLQ